MPELELLRRFAPPETTPAPEAEHAARAALLQRTRRRPRRPWLLAAPALVAAAALALVLVLAPSHEAPATAATFLRRAAHNVREVVPTRPLKPGQYLYTSSSDAFLTTVGDGPRPYSVLVPHTRETWLALDGTGWLKTTSGDLKWLSEADRAAWVAAGRPKLSGNGEGAIGTNDQDGPAPMTTPKLPTDPGALFAYLEKQAAGKGNGLHLEMFTLIGDSLREAYTTPEQRSALYEVAARLPGVELVGKTADHAGRPGVAVAMSDPVNKLREELIFDPRSGALLGEQETTLPGFWNHYAPGTVIGWSVYLRVDVVDRMKERPR
jgi:hypothetical protein